MSLSEPYLARSIFAARRLRSHFRRLATKQRLKFAPPPAYHNPPAFLRYLENLASLNQIENLVIKETYRQGREWDNVQLLDWVAAGKNPVVGITRHPYDAAVSTLRFCRWWRGIVGRVARRWVPGLPLFSDDEELMNYFATNWSDFVRWARQQNVTVTRYEDLVKAPEHEMRMVCARADVAFHPSMIDSTAPRTAFGGIGDPEVMNRKPRNVHACSIGRKKELRPHLVKIIQSSCADGAGQLGYDL